MSPCPATRTHTDVFVLLQRRCAIHAKRVTVMPKDIQLARRIRSRAGEDL